VNPSGGSDERPDTVVLTLSGDVDFFTEDTFRQQAEALLADPAPQRLIVDLSAVTLIDSSGLSLLVDLLRLCRELDLAMSLRDVPPQVGQLLKVTGLDQVLPPDSNPTGAMR
jgi:anti-anti-sigma factor